MVTPEGYRCVKVSLYVMFKLQLGYVGTCRTTHLLTNNITSNIFKGVLSNVISSVNLLYLLNTDFVYFMPSEYSSL